MTLEQQILTGMTESHVVDFQGAKVHKEVVSALTTLSSELKQNGFQLGIVSSFRGFESQLKIWNAKATGQRVLLNKNAEQLDYTKLTSHEIIHAILRWSALPGLSRHHWGTDMDVIDINSKPEGYKVQLVPSEFEEGGPFSKMHLWLDKNMSRFGFFRPYQKDLGGISPERWHISYAPLANKLTFKHSSVLAADVVKNSSVELKEEILSEMDSIFTKYFLTISQDS